MYGYYLDDGEKTMFKKYQRTSIAMELKESLKTIIGTIEYQSSTSSLSSESLNGSDSDGDKHGDEDEDNKLYNEKDYKLIESKLLFRN